MHRFLRQKKPLNAARQGDRWQLPSRQAPWGLSLLNSLSLHFDVFQQLYEINSNKLNFLQGQMIWMKTIVLGAISHLKLSDLRDREAAPFLCKAPLVGCIIGICRGSQKRLWQQRKSNQDPQLLLSNHSSASPLIYSDQKLAQHIQGLRAAPP